HTRCASSAFTSALTTRRPSDLQILLRLTGSQVQPAHSDRRDVDNIRRRVLNIEKARRTLRWLPEVTLEEGLRRTVEWQRQRNARSEEHTSELQSRAEHARTRLL